MVMLILCSSLINLKRESLHVNLKKFVSLAQSSVVIGQSWVIIFFSNNTTSQVFHIPHSNYPG